MIINDTLEEIRASQMVPKDHYKLRVISTGSPSMPNGGWPNGIPDTSWAVLNSRIIATKDPQTAHMIDQELKFWVIGNRSGRKGLGDFLYHKHLYDSNGGWDKGIPADPNGEKHLSNIVGIVYDAMVDPFEYKTGEKKGEWGYNIQPITQPDQPMLQTPEGGVPF